MLYICKIHNYFNTVLTRQFNGLSGKKKKKKKPLINRTFRPLATKTIVERELHELVDCSAECTRVKFYIHDGFHVERLIKKINKPHDVRLK